MAELIGFVECAHCGTEVQLKASKKSKAYYNCPIAVSSSHVHLKPMRL